MIRPVGSMLALLPGSGPVAAGRSVKAVFSGVANRVVTAENLDVVAEIGQRLGEVADVDALATAVGLAPIGEQSDAERGVDGCHERTSLSVH